MNVAAVREFIFTESFIFSVNIIPPLFFDRSSITDAETRLIFNKSLNKVHKFGNASFVSTSRLQILFRLSQEELHNCQCSLANSSVSDNITVLDRPSCQKYSPSASTSEMISANISSSRRCPNISRIVPTISVEMHPFFSRSKASKAFFNTENRIV